MTHSCQTTSSGPNVLDLEMDAETRDGMAAGSMGERVMYNIFIRTKVKEDSSCMLCSLLLLNHQLTLGICNTHEEEVAK